MALGAISCETREVKNISQKIRFIKSQHKVSKSFEVKWTKVSPAKIELYVSLIEYFLLEDSLRFRGMLVTDKSALDHKTYNQSHDDFYYKMYYILLKYMIHPPHEYYFYVDIKDTKGGNRTKKLHDVLANKFHDFDKRSIRRVQQIRSDESEILQLTDLLIGAITYSNRGLDSSSAKTTIIKMLTERFGENHLSKTSPFSNIKFNILKWDAQN